MSACLGAGQDTQHSKSPQPLSANGDTLSPLRDKGTEVPELGTHLVQGRTASERQSGSTSPASGSFP